MTDLSLRAALLVAAGAVPGALARWALAGWLSRGFPWGTALVNVSGSFLIGALLFGGLARGALGPDARAFLAIGFLGAYTTMSSFAYDTIALAEAGDWARAGLNVALNPVLSLAGAWAGRAVALAYA